MRYTTLKALCKRIGFELKSLRLLFIAPLIFVHLFLPLASYMLSRKHPDEYLSYIIMLGMLIIPVSSIMWGLFILKENVEGKGNELLYIGNNKIKLLDFLIPFVLFCLIDLLVLVLSTAIGNLLSLFRSNIFTCVLNKVNFPFADDADNIYNYCVFVQQQSGQLYTVYESYTV